jgi:hypothetical protein
MIERVPPGLAIGNDLLFIAPLRDKEDFEPAGGELAAYLRELCLAVCG